MAKHTLTAEPFVIPDAVQLRLPALPPGGPQIRSFGNGGYRPSAAIVPLGSLDEATLDEMILEWTNSVRQLWATQKEAAARQEELSQTMSRGLQIDDLAAALRS